MQRPPHWGMADGDAKGARKTPVHIYYSRMRGTGKESGCRSLSGLFVHKKGENLLTHAGLGAIIITQKEMR